MRSIIVDDEQKAITIIERYIENIPSITIAGTFRNALDALSFLHTNEVDLIFLDINMPEVSGLEMLSSLTNPPLVILTTAYSEFALEGYEHGVVDYLLKPFSIQRFLKAVNRAIQIKESKTPDTKTEKRVQEKIVIRQDGTVYNITLKDLLYCEAYGNYVKVHTTSKTHVIRSKMHEIEAKLPSDEFIRVHRSFIVSLNKIEKVEGNMIHLNDKQIQIGLYYKSHFFSVFN